MGVIFAAKWVFPPPFDFDQDCKSRLGYVLFDNNHSLTGIKRALPIQESVLIFVYSFVADWTSASCAASRSFRSFSVTSNTTCSPSLPSAATAQISY